MSVKSDRGRAGEEHVCAYLKKHGYTVLERNYRVRGGEIDIIAERSGIIAFVEVKTRKFGSLGNGIDAIDRRKQSLVIRAADRYLEDHPANGKSIRFDAAAVVITTEEHPRVIEMKYIEDAFDAFGI